MFLCAADSAGRALGGVITKFRSLKDCGYKTYTKLFDTGVLSILNYGSEVWGYGKYEKCDTVINRAMRYYLGVHKHAPTAGVQGEMGWLSLIYRRYIVMLRFWNRLLHMDNTRLTKRIFLWGHAHPNHNWCSDIRSIADSLGMIHIYDRKASFDISYVQSKCFQLMQIDWLNHMQVKPKLRLYNTFKSEFGVEPYVKYYVPKNIRSVFAQIRIGILPLHIETGRFVNVAINDRVCNICNSYNVEDEIHFIFSCEAYINERRVLFDHCINILPDFMDMTDNEKLKYLMTVEWKILMKFVNDVWCKHKLIEYT